MRKYYSIPLVFFLLAALLGLFLRWQFISPTPGIRFAYFVHGHSHVMFLGWVFNVLYLALVEHHIDSSRHRRYLNFFLLLQILVFAMMISFPVQGYGAFSIAFSTAHTVAVMIFIPVFFRHTSGTVTAALWFARMSWIFFFVSTLGPFALGYLMASGMGTPTWNNISIYYYLHFQYNGFFLFGIFSLFFSFLQNEGIAIDHPRMKTFGKWMAIACVPTYFLSVLFARPFGIFYWLGGAGAVIQLIALVMFVHHVFQIKDQLRSRVKPLLVPVGYVILATLFTKALLQLASAHPFVAELAYSMRPVVIAYLHLVLVGIISLFLVAWYIQRNLMDKVAARTALIALMIGFTGSEAVLVLLPWWGITPFDDMTSVTLIFVFSVFMVIAALLFTVAFVQNQGAPPEGFPSINHAAEPFRNGLPPKKTNKNQLSP